MTTYSRAPSLLFCQGNECTTVVLTSTADGAYDIEEEILVTRSVTITGSPVKVNGGKRERHMGRKRGG